MRDGIFYRKRKEGKNFRVSSSITGDSLLEDVVHYEGVSDKSYQDARADLLKQVDNDLYWLNNLKSAIVELQEDF